LALVSRGAGIWSTWLLSREEPLPGVGRAWFECRYARAAVTFIFASSPDFVAGWFDYRSLDRGSLVFPWALVQSLNRG